MKIADVPSAAAIITAATDGQKVARVRDHGDIIWGTARHIVTDPISAGFARPSDDITEQLLRVTSTKGYEHFWPVQELIDEHKQGLFVTDVEIPKGE